MFDSLINALLTVNGKRPGPGDPLVRPPQPPGPAWMKWAAGIAIVNFFAFTAIAMYIGGDALNGYVKDGHYFLAMHGHAYEVSRNVFLYSKWHTIITIVTFVILISLSPTLKRRVFR